ncbi:MAG: Biotin carboxylase [Calditrichaeota bacterium]|nr:Biotin carboxylase [Calditrichota bacterium]
MFAKVLIANRGEIAVRVIRACREAGVRAVAVYSDVDRRALHVQLADEAVHIGPAVASESYLNGRRIIEAAKQTGAEAIHPGYGFLSENADFAELVESSGLTWIGPPPVAIRAMGSKTEARRLMKDAGVPVVPGTEGGIDDPADAPALADEIGYPVLIKAAMGGGGKGMRVVRDQKQLAAAVEAAKRESLNAFGSEIVYLEKFIERPRHIEFQVFADDHGNTVHLGERECSIQRRHQKVVEECPSAIVTPEMRAQMGESAVRAAEAVGYRNAGTVEFLVDQDRSHYFLEMNTRLQVEHPVTEMVTGVDLVELQLHVASGGAIPFRQDELAMRGHAIEVRIYSEDSLNGFVPDTGTLRYLRPPYGYGIREDSGVQQGDAITIHYDPMISKLIAWAPDRETAIRRMDRALSEYRVTGVRTTIPFGRFVMNNGAFQRGDFDTSFVEREFDLGLLEESEQAWRRIAALAAAWRRHTETSESRRSDEHPLVESVAGSGSWKATGRRQALR